MDCTRASGEGRRVAAVLVLRSIDVLAQLVPAGEIIFHAPAANQLRFSSGIQSHTQ